MNHWTGDYTSVIREFAFLLRIDGEIHTYTQQWRIVGAQPAKRKRDWVEVEMGVPEAWWRDVPSETYKARLVAEVEKGLRSMIDLLCRNRHPVKVEELLGDWTSVKRRYLEAE